MKKLLYLLLSYFFFTSNALAQNNEKPIDRLKIFVDCVNTYCAITYLKSEITVVDFLLDNKAADVHIIITEQNTGGGGEQYQLLFFGQNSFKKDADTIRFNTDRNATEFEIRDQLMKYLMLGLAPFVAKTTAAKDVKMDFKQSISNAGNDKSNPSGTTKDPWNYWVFKVGVNGNIRADAVYKSTNFNSSVSANRTTEEIKIGFNGRISKNNSGFEYKDSSGIKKITVKNHNYIFDHFLIKSITQHWSAAYSTELEQSTFENTKQRLNFKAAAEYNIFPYQQVNTKFFAVRYYLDVARNQYFDTTLYDKTKETLFGYGAETKLSINQKWGNTSLGVEYHNYFKKGNLFNLSGNAEVDVRITGGLSFKVDAYGELVRDQLSLPKKGATGEEVLTRRRQLASGYKYFLSFGLNYRFGSNLNNFVNPRFD